MTGGFRDLVVWVLLMSLWYGFTGSLSLEFKNHFYEFMFRDYITFWDTHHAALSPRWDNSYLLVIAAILLVLAWWSLLRLLRAIALIIAAWFITLSILAMLGLYQEPLSAMFILCGVISIGVFVYATLRTHDAAASRFKAFRERLGAE